MYVYICINTPVRFVHSFLRSLNSFQDCFFLLSLTFGFHPVNVVYCVLIGVQEFMREARIMVTLNHPCIVKLIGVTGGKPMMLVG